MKKVELRSAVGGVARGRGVGQQRAVDLHRCAVVGWAWGKGMVWGVGAGYIWGMRRFLRFLGCFLLVGVLGAAGFMGWLVYDLPAPQEIENRLATPSIRIVDRRGRLLYEAGGNGRQANLPLDEIPDNIRWATIATEDRNYENHPGVDVMGIVRAMWINFQGGEVLAGGSTITQQLARTLLLDVAERQERTVWRKLRESWLAWRLAQVYSKDEILAFYLNQIYYGGHAYGVEAAAQTYFGRAATDLTLAQAALLVGLPQAPSYYNPLLNPDEAKGRQEVVLGLMLKDGHISQAVHDQAVVEPLPYSSRPYPIEAPHFVMMVQGVLDQLLTVEGQYLSGGLTVRTTLDLDWQRRGEEILRGEIEALQNPQGLGYSHQVSNGALVAMNPHDGDVLTLIGSPDYFDDEIGGAINMALAPRQPGSTLKPMIYAAGMNPERPEPYTAATMFLDVETLFFTQDGEPYVPVNFSRTEHGPMLLRQALASSLNIPAVQALQAVGLDEGIGLMRDMGLQTFAPDEELDLAFALGGGEVRLFDLTRVYAAFANGGERITPRLILEVTDSQGAVVYQAEESERTRVLDERVAWLISDVLSDNGARELSFGPNSVLQIGRPAAVKTGTTNDLRDNWTVGYTADLVVGTWIGNGDYSPMVGVTGVSGAGPIWHKFVRSVTEGVSEPRPFVRPEGLVQEEVCGLSGLLPSRWCPFTRTEWFIEGTVPRQFDEVYQLVEIDTETGLLATEYTPFEQKEKRLVLDLPASAYRWAQGEGLPLLADLLTRQDEFVQAVNEAEEIVSPLRLVTPANQAAYRWSASVPAEAQRLPLEAVSDVGLRELRIVVDEQVVAVLRERPYQTFWQLEIGAHVVWLEGVTDAGEILTTEPIFFEVRPPDESEFSFDE